MRILIWQDYGSIRVYELDTEAKVENARKQLLSAAMGIGLEVDLESDIQDVVYDIRNQAQGGDVESFEYLAISYTKVY